MATSLQPTAPTARLLPVGWGVALLVAVLVYLSKPDDELRFSLLVGAVALSMGAWTYGRGSRASAAVSLVLALLWTLLFAGYAIAGLSDDASTTLVFITDLIAVCTGLLIGTGAVAVLRNRRHDRHG